MTNIEKSKETLKTQYDNNLEELKNQIEVLEREKKLEMQKTNELLLCRDNLQKESSDKQAQIEKIKGDLKNQVKFFF